MPNQTPHTPQVSSVPEGATLAMKPPIISPEIYERFEQLIAKPFSPEVIEACNKAQRQKIEVEEIKEQELLNSGYTQEDKELVLDWKNRYPDWYRENGKSLIFGENFIGIEADGKILKFDREDLKIEKLTRNLFTKMADKIHEEGIINRDGHTYFTFNVAQREAEKRGKRLPRKEEWRKIIDFMPGNADNEKTENLIKILKLNFAGYFYGIDGFKNDSVNRLSVYWSSSTERNINKKERIDGTALIIGLVSILGDHFLSACLLVRCIEEIENPEFRKKLI